MTDASDPERLLDVQSDEFFLPNKGEINGVPVDDSNLPITIPYHPWQRWRERSPDWSVDIKTAYKHSTPVVELKMDAFKTDAGKPDRVHLFGEHNGVSSYLMVLYFIDDTMVTTINIDDLFAVSSPTKAYLQALGDQQGYTIPRDQRSVNQLLMNP